MLGRNMFKGIYKADIGLDCQFVPLGQIGWSEIRRARFQRQSTGLARDLSRINLPLDLKKAVHKYIFSPTMVGKNLGFTIGVAPTVQP